MDLRRQDVKPGVCDDHDDEGDEVDGGEEEEGEGFDGVGVSPEGDALLVLWGIGVGVSAPSEQLRLNEDETRL